jgi:CheY-like chemotaxis protein
MIASDGIQAFMSIRTTLKNYQTNLNPFKLIILDYSLPSMNCFSIIRQNLPLFQKKDFKVPKIIILSEDSNNEEECLREVDYFLQKPVDIKAFLHILQTTN